MIDVDLVTNQSTNKPYQGVSYWGQVTIATLVCGVISVLAFGWYVLKYSITNQKITNQTEASAKLDSEITTANAWATGTTVEDRVSGLLTSLSNYQNIINSRKAWSKIVPLISASTLNSITLSGMSVDANLNIQIDGSAYAANGVDNITAYGMVARQVIAYRDAKVAVEQTSSVESKSTSDNQTETTTNSNSEDNKVLVFKNVTLTAVSNQQANSESESSSSDVALFSINLTLNSDLVKIDKISSSSSKSTTP